MKKLVGQLIVWHRLLGIGSCLFFAMWFVSGIVMMYARMPELTEDQRLKHEERLDLSTLRVSPLEATQTFNAPVRVVLCMAGSHPVYRILTADGRWHGIYADTGMQLDPLPATTAVDLAHAFTGESSSPMRWKKTLTDVDQWTVYPASRTYLPFQLVAANDAAGTEYYVSGATCQMFLVTTRRGRLMAWLGAIPHWWYLRALRANTPAWRAVMIVASSIGVIMCLAGIIAGFFRFSPSKRYRFRGQPNSHFPHTGMKRWHYYLGFVFGLVTFTWILSGLFSMNPGQWSPGPLPTADEAAAFAGGPIRPDGFHLTPATALSRLSQCSGVKELEMTELEGRSFYLGKGGNGASNLLAASGEAAVCQSAISVQELTRAASALMQRAPIQESTLLADYDSYYYDQHRQKPLPVLRVKFGDSKHTWLYINPRTATIESRYTNRSRLERWLYNGLHTLDFPFLYRSRPLWDVIVIALSLGGIALSSTGIVLGWRYLSRGKKKKPGVVSGASPSKASLA